MAYGFNDDKSKFDINAALSSTQAAAVAESRSIESQKVFSSLQEFKSWTQNLPVGQHTITCSNSVSQALGLPWSTYSLIRIYKANTSSIMIYAQNISRAAVQYGLECCLPYNGSWGNWTRLFDDILPGDVKTISVLTQLTARALSATQIRVSVPFNGKIRATSVIASGKIFVTCMGSAAGFVIGETATATCQIDKSIGAVLMILNLDSATAADLLRQDYAVIAQTYSATSQQLTFTFS